MNRIKELREDRDLKQVEIAEKIGIDQKTLSNYETGKTNPDSFAIIKLAEFFGVTCDYLLGITDRNFINDESILKEIQDIKNRLDNISRYIKRK